MRSKCIVAILILFVLGCTTAEVIKAKTKTQSPLIGKDLTDANFDLRYEVKNYKLTVVNFWETWCEPCKIELPEFEKIYQKNKANKVLFVGVHHLSPLSKIKPTINELKVTFPIVYDETKKISDEFKVIGTPTTVVLDPDFRIIRRFEGIDTGLSDFISAQLQK